MTVPEAAMAAEMESVSAEVAPEMPATVAAAVPTTTMAAAAVAPAASSRERVRPDGKGQ
jgi:hypothetical protein